MHSELVSVTTLQQVTDLLRQYFTDTFIQSDLQASNTHTHQEQPCALQPLAPGHFNT